MDPVISSALDDALDEKELSEVAITELFKCKGTEMGMVLMVADELRRRAAGDLVTYVINRNINFTNVCVKRCGFCAFSRGFLEEEGYILPIEEIVTRAKEAWKLGATEVCIQAGLPPKMDGKLYIDICRAIKKALPDIHIHAFSPEEILYGARSLGVPIPEYMKMLKEAGVGSHPGTAAEILDQHIRDVISPGRIKVSEWVSIIKYAHYIGIPTTSTIMYGHIESPSDRAKHLILLRSIQKETGGFTEFVPLSFVHTEAPMYSRHTVPGLRAGANGNEVLIMHAVARIALYRHINNIQVSWVKEGLRMSQLLLGAGANDFGGTLINESISTSAGSSYGQILKPKEIRSAIRSAGKIPAQRSTSYRLLKTYEGEEKDDFGSLLDRADPSQFGSYGELIKLDQFRYKV
ncbi:MAG TPA: 5-amino-6-(D-ribitylamino)uracil--L-tyrosine 4-hydroxyphenyl transferase CofH [Nitrososphaeraceae archaeon]|nr:5-amino-6-(D-ribitylamino)uracil--L-tyrosine 4-hydroxyphenyl transferase CofH [Nitrososphaeraceae archaeon]